MPIFETGEEGEYVNSNEPYSRTNELERTGTEGLETPIGEEEFAHEQSNYDIYQAFARTVGLPNSKLDVDQKRLLVQRSELDGAFQKVVQNSLQK